MNKSKFKKRIVIGSANFDLNYGIENKKINNAEINKIIKFAISNNILTIDTAESYLKNNKLFQNIDSRFKFITKIKPDQHWTSLKYCKKMLSSHLNTFHNNSFFQSYGRNTADEMYNSCLRMYFLKFRR